MLQICVAPSTFPQAELGHGKEWERDDIRKVFSNSLSLPPSLIVLYRDDHWLQLELKLCAVNVSSCPELSFPVKESVVNSADEIGLAHL